MGPNILLLHTDQQRWDTIRANANNVIKTPNLDRLAATGVNFDHCIAQNPVCMPSRLSMMTGRYCSALRVTQMGVTVPNDLQTLQKVLGGRGYQTALIGKLHYLPHSNRDHRQPHPPYGFDHLELSDEPGCYEDSYRAWVRRVAPYQLDNISLGLPPATQEWQRLLGFRDGIKHPRRIFGEWSEFAGDENVTHTAFVGQRTIDYIRSRRGDPFFCFSGFYSPHEPFVAPRRYIDMYDVNDMPVPHFPEGFAPNRADSSFTDDAIRGNTRAYYAMISEVDSWIGKILDSLEDLGIVENTIVVFTSDHGEFLGEHMRYGKGPWAPDVISRVPLIIRAPEALGGAMARHVGDIVECVDIMPTLLDLAGMQIPPDVQGDLLPVTADRDSCPGDGLGLVEWHGGRSLRLADYRYVAEVDKPDRLFHLLEDPMEYRDVAETVTHAGALAKARTALINRMMRIEQPMPIEWPY